MTSTKCDLINISTACYCCISVRSAENPSCGNPADRCKHEQPAGDVNTYHIVNIIYHGKWLCKSVILGVNVKETYLPKL